MVIICDVVIVISFVLLLVVMGQRLAEILYEVIT